MALILHRAMWVISIWDTLGSQAHGDTGKEVPGSGKAGYEGRGEESQTLQKRAPRRKCVGRTGRWKVRAAEAMMGSGHHMDSKESCSKKWSLFPGLG